MDMSNSRIDVFFAILGNLFQPLETPLLISFLPPYGHTNAVAHTHIQNTPPIQTGGMGDLAFVGGGGSSWLGGHMVAYGGPCGFSPEGRVVCVGGHYYVRQFAVTPLLYIGYWLNRERLMEVQQPPMVKHHCTWQL